MFGQGILDTAGHGIGNALIEERLLAFEQELLVAQGTDRQPSQHQTRQEDSEDKNQRDFFHFGCFISRRLVCQPDGKMAIHLVDGTERIPEKPSRGAATAP